MEVPLVGSSKIFGSVDVFIKFAIDKHSSFCELLMLGLRELLSG